MNLPMDPANLLVLAIVGAIAGWLAGLVMRGHGFGLLGNIVVGVVGAYIGTWLFQLLGISLRGMLGTWGSAIATATIGAVVLLFLVRLIKNL